MFVDRKFTLAQWAILGIAVMSASRQAGAQPAESSQRVTPLVQVIQEIDSAVISLFVPTDEKYQYSSGSGTIIHPNGYVLTNNHVLPKTEGFAAYRDKPVRFAVIGRLPEKDIAILRLRDVSGPLPTIPLGHSHDVMNGESVVVAGNPGGRGVVYTAGIVSSSSVIIDAPNALAMTQLANSRRDNFIQFDAASNRGNSGGPLVNMDGKLIGIVSALIPQEQNVGFAIPVDRVRELLDRVLDPEVIYEKSMGVRLNPQADAAIVAEVATGSAAAKAGLQSGDTIVSAAGSKLRNAADWTMMLHQRLPAGNPIQVVATRGGNELPMKLVPDKNPALEGVVVDNAEPGLNFKFYHGKFDLIPDFDELEPARSGVVENVDLETIRADREDEFAVVLDGLMQVEHDGLYRLTVISDDGSRVYLHGELFIDHDGNHPPMPASRLLRAKAGLHPIRVEQFEGTGRETLELKLERNGKGPDEQPELKFFHDKE